MKHNLKFLILDKDIGLKSICRVFPEAEIKRMNAEDKNDIKW